MAIASDSVSRSGGRNAPQGGPRVVLYGFIAFIAVVALAFAGVLLLR